MICNCCAVSPLLENFTFVSPPKTDLLVVIKWSGTDELLFDVEVIFVLLGFSAFIVKMGEFGELVELSFPKLLLLGMSEEVLFALPSLCSFLCLL